MKKIIGISLLLLVSIVASITINAQNMNERIPLNSKIKTGKLSNGLTYYIMQNNKPEKRAELWIKFLAGSVQEDDYQRGLAHFIEHMCFNGTKNFPKDSLLKFLEGTGVRFGADINAHTAFDETTYTLTVPTDVDGVLEKGMQVLEDWAMNVTFDSTEIEKERGVIIEEERMRDANAQARIQNIQFQKLFQGSKYADRMPIGLTEIIKNAKRQDFVNYYNEWYRPDLCAVIVVGDINVSEIENMIKKHFDHFKYRGTKAARPKGKYPVADNKEPIISILSDKELQVGQASIIFKQKERDELTYSSYRETIKENLFAIMFNMRLSELTKEPKPPFLGGYGVMTSFIKDLRLFLLMAATNQNDFKGGFERLLAEAFRVDQHGFTKTELDRAKESILANYEKSYNERDKSENQSYTRELAAYFEGTESAPGIEVEFALVKEWLPTITIDEVNKLVKEQISKENVVFWVSLPENSTDKPTDKDVLAIFDEVEKTTYEPYIDDLGDAQLMKTLPTAGKITSTKKLPNHDITEMILSNGARVLLKPTDFKNDQILFSCQAKGGASLYPVNEYQLVTSSAEIVDNNGLGEFSSTKLAKLLQSKMISLSPYIGNYNQGISGSTTPKDMEVFFQLLNMQFTQPRIDNDAFEAWKNQNIEVLRNKDNDPMNAYYDTMSAVMENYHAWSKSLTEEDINGFKQDRALAIYKERFADASNFLFIFVGSFEIDKIKPLIEQYIGSLPATKKGEQSKDINVRPMMGQVNKIVKRGIEPKSTVMLMLNGDLDYTSENIMKLAALREIASIKIRESIREDKGGVYSPGVGAQPSYFPWKSSLFRVYFTCDPNRVDELVAASKEVMNTMIKTISEEDLHKAKEILKKEMETSIKENNFWLRNIQAYETTGRDMAFLNDYNKKIDELKVKDMVDAASKYFNPTKNIISLIQMPEDDE